jgi:hypothetical protein
MKPEHTLEQQQHLQSVCEAFEQWRRTRQKKERIPESLWEAAVDLSASYSAFRIAKTLRLDFKRLKYRIHKHSCRSVPCEFVEVKASPLFTAASCIVEIRSPSGFELKIQTDATLQSQLPDLISSFVSRSR